MPDDRAQAKPNARRPDEVSSTNNEISEPPRQSLAEKLADVLFNQHNLLHDGASGLVRQKDNPINERCKTDLMNLRKVFPKVEAAYRPGQTSGVPASEVRALCRIYLGVALGGFCPHSHFVFDWGRDIVEILRRVCFLLHHLISNSTIENDLLQTDTGGSNETIDNTEPTTLAAEICTTVSSLLNLASAPRANEAIVQDLITLSFDLATIIKAEIFSFDEKNDQESGPLEVIVFEEATRLDASSGQTQYSLTILNGQQLLALQGGIQSILGNLLSLQRGKRMKDLLLSDTPVSPCADSLFFTCLGVNDWQASLMATLRQSVFDLPSSSTTSGSGRTQKMTRGLLMQRGESALKLMLMLLQDGHKGSIVSRRLLGEVADVVLSATMQYFRFTGTCGGEDVSTVQERTLYERRLALAIIKSLLSPPCSGGQVSDAENVWCIRGKALLPLLNCVSVFAESRIPSDDFETHPPFDVNETPSANDELLMTTVMQTIYACLCTTHPSGTTALKSHAQNHCVANNTFPSLFSMLGNKSLSSIALQVLLKLLEPTEDGTERLLLDIESVCQSAMQEVRLEAETANFETPNRNRGTTNTNNDAEQNRLDLAWSPMRQRKRRRFAGSVDIHRSIATPPSGIHQLLDSGEGANCKEHETGFLEREFIELLTYALESAEEFRSNPISIFNTQDKSVLDPAASRHIYNVRSVKNAASLLHGFVKLSSSETNGVDNKYCLAQKLISHLFQSLERLCTYMQANETQLKTASPEMWYAVIDSIIEVGIFSHFSSNSHAESHPENNAEVSCSIAKALDTFSCLALNSWTAEFLKDRPEPNAKNFLSSDDGSHDLCCVCGLCSNIEENISQDARRFRYSRRCFMRDFGVLTEHSDVFEDENECATNLADATMESQILLSRASLSCRCILLSFLRPVDDADERLGEHQNGSELRHPSSALEKTFSLLCSSHPRAGNKMVKTELVIVLLPVLFSSVACKFRTNNESNATAASKGATVPKNLLRALEKLLQLAISAFVDGQSEVTSLISQASCVTIVRLGAMAFELSEDKGMNASCRDLANLLSYLDSRPCDGGANRTSLANEPYATFLNKSQSSLISFQFSIRSSDISPSCRLEMWNCLAWICSKPESEKAVSATVDPQQILDQSTKYAEAALNRSKLFSGTDREMEWREDDSSTQAHLPSVLWLIHSCFADTDSSFRNYSANRIGRVILAHNACFLRSAFCTSDEKDKIAQFEVGVEDGASFRSAVTPAVNRLFALVDKFLVRFCRFSNSRLSSSAASQVPMSTNQTNVGATSVLLSLQTSALYALSSLCQNADTETLCGSLVFEHAFSRMLAIWAADQGLGEDDGTRKAASAIAFGEMMKIHLQHPLRDFLLGRNGSGLCLALFAEVLCPSCSPVKGEASDPEWIKPDNRKRRYLSLLTFITHFLLPCKQQRMDAYCHGDSSSNELALMDAIELVDKTLTVVLPLMIIDKDYALLRMTVGFKVFLLGRRNSLKSLDRSFDYSQHESRNAVVGDVNSTRSRQGSLPAGLREDTKKLSQDTKMLCVSPRIVYHILAKLFLCRSEEPTNFFLETVARNNCTLHRAVKINRLRILKLLVLELASEVDDESVIDIENFRDSLAVGAIQKCAVSLLDSRNDDTTNTTSQSPREDSTDLAIKFVSSNFMFLLVNVVQTQWTRRTPWEKLRAMRCLKAIMSFLVPAEACQFVPQVLATVNMAMGNDMNIQGKNMSETDQWRLKLLSVQVMSHFVRLICTSQYETIGSNLTTIVVSLFPVLGDANTMRAEGTRYAQNAKNMAIELLEWMASGEVGKNLSTFFREVPLLPPLRELDRMRSRLKRNGVDIDNFLSLSPTQSGNRSQVLSRSGSNDAVNPYTSSRAPAALQKRLDMLTLLVTHEHVSVRRVALKHITDIISSNRSLFQTILENEESTSSKGLLTVAANKCRRENLDRIGCVSGLLQSLLNRCALEDDPDCRALVARTLGEIGALDINRFQDVDISLDQSADFDRMWRLQQPPWRSTAKVRYQLQLVTCHLCVALKAASSSADQHKIAFTIQQLLVQLNDSAQRAEKRGKKTSSRSTKIPSDQSKDRSSSREEMTVWLAEKLKEAGVLEVIEPFWSTKYTDRDVPMIRQAPFFRTSTSYFQWISRFAGYLVNRTNGDSSPWHDFLFACRTAIRSSAGVSVVEFIFPLLVLDGFTFGKDVDQRIVVQELKDALASATVSAEEPPKDDSSMSWTHRMTRRDRQKCVSTVFAVLDTIEFWAENEKEERHKSTRRSSSSARRAASAASSSSDRKFSADNFIEKIDEIGQEISLALRAEAAAYVSMHARSLRFLEMETRSRSRNEKFSTENDNGRKDIGTSLVQGSSTASDNSLHEGRTALLKEVLGKLDDRYTTEAIVQESQNTDIVTKLRDSIAEKEACSDWAGALQDYEGISQISNSGIAIRTETVQKGMLRCLLQLGQFESVLTMANGLTTHPRYCGTPSTRDVSDGTTASDSVPFAVEAAWRLGRWETLEELLDSNENAINERDAEGAYQLSIGRAMLGLSKKSPSVVFDALEEAGKSVMTQLQGLARESYSRCYGQLLRLHCLREIEIAANALCPTSDAFDAQDRSQWDMRLDVVSRSGTTTVIDTRLALVRFEEDWKTEGSLHIEVGKRARKAGLVSIAEHAFANAEISISRLSLPGHQDSVSETVGHLQSTLQLQLAKLKHFTGQSGTALAILGQDNVHQLFNKDARDLRKHVVELEQQRSLGAGTNACQEDELIVRFARRVLQSTRWMVEGGLKGGPEILSRYRVIESLRPNSENSYFHFAKYVDSLLECRLSARSSQVSTLHDDGVRANVLIRDACCRKYLLLAIKQYGQALRISPKHLFEALPRLLSLWFEFTAIDAQAQRGVSSIDVSATENCRRSQREVNEVVSEIGDDLPEHLFYTAMPQIISRAGHSDERTKQIVLKILVRVLSRYPEQGLWSLAWLMNSINKERLRIGEKIFKEAQSRLGRNKQKQSLLVSSKSLFRYLIQVAKHQPKDSNDRSVKVQPWKGEVPLSDFVPPTQAALSVSPRSLGKVGTQQHSVFNPLVPRMRSFHSNVQVMTSKAKPKRIIAHAIPSKQLRTSRSKNGGSDDARDIGELHFLLKQEAKGDLRKDARVQDLNNVINRLLATSKGTNSAHHHRRLRLRTFSVVCLSEECGIIEWVANTNSLRNLVSSSYNPQVEAFSTLRRGSRIANLGEPMLRQAFDDCQAICKRGNVKKAAQMFEENLLNKFPPIFYWWFVQNFQDPHAWYEARTAFTMSAAAWSAVGHVIGLGDRHSENILIDTKSGDCVHVDFDCIFDKGLMLPQPEIVPFRLTQNMVDAFGPVGADGIYTGCLKTAMSTLRNNRDLLLSVLEPFLKDPIIDWKRYRSQQPRNDDGRETLAAKKSIKVLDGRLRGVYNLRLHPSRRVKRTDIVEEEDDMTHFLPLSVEGQVQKMIAEATSNENLVQIYVGWMPWL